ncbi:2-dehydropantoate 2-reductase [bacterium]|nr:2-dehydropantoate 2-reductase [bacterium]
MKQYNILIYGTGAVGIYFGGKLYQAGFNTTFVDLPEKVRKIENKTLSIRSEGSKDYVFSPPIVEDVFDLPVQDIVLICVKAFQTYDIALNLLPVIKPTTIILSLQNGLENERILSDLLGKNLVMGSVIYFSGILDGPSTVVKKAPGQIIFGETDHQGSQREEWLSKIFSHADINHKISRNINLEVWKKFIWSNAYNSVSALTSTTLKQIHQAEGILHTIRQMMTEVQQIAEAEGIQIPNQILDELINSAGNYADVKTSMLKDMESGQMPELEAIVGVVLKKAEKHGITTPVNQTIYNLIRLSLKNIDYQTEEKNALERPL